MKNLYDYLSPEYSWWVVGWDNTVRCVNETKPTKENIRFIFYCDDCDADHVAELKDICRNEFRDYSFRCEHHKEDYQTYISRYKMPKEIEELLRNEENKS